MKTIQAFTLLIASLLLFQCDRENNTSTPRVFCEFEAIKTITISTQDELTLAVPICYDHVKLQGIDSYVGRIEATDIGLEINYDIGGWAGTYVRDNDPNQTTLQGDFEEFRFALDGDRLVFTFPNAGPANFFTQQLELQDEVIAVLRTLQVN